MVGAIESVTVGVQDLDAAVADFRDRLRLTVLFDACVSVGQLAAWRRPVHESVRLVELGTPGSALGHIRLAQFESEISTETSAGALSVGACGLGGTFATLAIVTDDPAASERFYTEGLGWGPVPEVSRGAAELYPAGSPRLAGYCASEGSALEVVVAHFPNSRVRKPREPALPGRLGINLATCRCEALNQLEERLAAIGIEPVTRPTHVGLPLGRPARVMLVRGPADELFELIEPAD